MTAPSGQSEAWGSTVIFGIFIVSCNEWFDNGGV
jgi:hypothetical protein